MLDLVHIHDIIEHQLNQKIEQDSYMTDEAAESCREFLRAFDEGRIQIVARVP